MGEATTKRLVTMVVNGERRSAEVEPRMLLVHYLREELGLTGTHIGCDTTSCGACTVRWNGRPVKSCTVFAIQAEGDAIETVEGLARAGGQFHPIQQGFQQEHGLQCGFCTPGMMMTAISLLEECPAPSERQIREAIAGNLCRCTGYINIIRAVRHAADLLQTEEASAGADKAVAATGSAA